MLPPPETRRSTAKDEALATSKRGALPILRSVKADRSAGLIPLRDYILPGTPSYPNPHPGGTDRGIPRAAPANGRVPSASEAVAC